MYTIFTLFFVSDIHSFASSTNMSFNYNNNTNSSPATDPDNVPCKELINGLICTLDLHFFAFGMLIEGARLLSYYIWRLRAR